MTKIIKFELELDFTKEFKETKYKEETLEKAIKITLKRYKKKYSNFIKKRVLKGLMDY